MLVDQYIQIDEVLSDSSTNPVQNKVITQKLNEKVSYNELAENKEFWLTNYPIGSVYFSENEISPAELWGGTWIKYEGIFSIPITEVDKEIVSSRTWANSFQSILLGMNPIDNYDNMPPFKKIYMWIRTE